MTFHDLEAKAATLATKLGVELKDIEHKVLEELHAVLDKLHARADTDAAAVKTDLLKDVSQK